MAVERRWKKAALPTGWTEATLGSIGEWLSGGTPSKSRADYWNGAVPWVSPKDMKHFSITDTHDHISVRAVSDGASVVPRGTVLIVVRGMILAHSFPVGIAEHEVSFNQDVKAIVPNGTADGRFVAHWLNGRSNQMLRLVTEATHGTKRIELAPLLEHPLLLPPAPEQRRIAEILDLVDDAIAKSEQLIAKLKQMKQGLLHDLLTRGIDENGELRDPGRHPEEFKDSELGRIPKDWEVVTLERVSESVTSGSRGWASFYAESGAVFVRIGNLTREHINLRLDNIVYVRPPRRTEGQRTRLVAGDLLISITADLGIVGVVPTGLGEAYVNQHIALVRIDIAKANSRWLGHYMAAPTAQKQIRLLDDPGAKAGLNLPTVRKLCSALPPREEQDEIVHRIDALDGRIDREERFRAKLSLLRQGLMDDLLSGRVRVTKLEESAA
jgi:type I restriction enzyme, S subunit